MSEAKFHAGTIRRLDDGRCKGVLQRTYSDHDSAELWEFLTNPVKIGQWLAPGSIELRRDGRVMLDFEDSGIAIDSKVLTLEPGRVLAYSWSHGSEPKRPLHWQVDDVSDGACLTLTVGIPAGEDAAKACAGFEAHLEMLGAALEGVPLQFPFDLFMRARDAYNNQLEV